MENEKWQMIYGKSSTTCFDTTVLHPPRDRLAACRTLLWLRHDRRRQHFRDIIGQTSVRVLMPKLVIVSQRRHPGSPIRRVLRVCTSGSNRARVGIDDAVNDLS